MKCELNMNIFMKNVSVYVLQCMSSKFQITVRALCSTGVTVSEAWQVKYLGSLCMTYNTRKIRDLGDRDYFIVHT